MAFGANSKKTRRAPGSEWLKNHPHFLEKLYHLTLYIFRASYPLMKHIAPRTSERFIIATESAIKGWIFNCQMCGQCVLHSTGMTCPMTCPKEVRNGPCGGVRPNGNCEVIPELPCVWVQAWERSQQMKSYTNNLHIIQAPVNRSLQDTSSWINMIEEKDVQVPAGWTLGHRPIDS
jgi:Methylene-tetrahydrofolate reductase C terminal